MNEITTTKKIMVCGTSLVINVTKESQCLGVEQGDYVTVVIKKITEITNDH